MTEQTLPTRSALVTQIMTNRPTHPQRLALPSPPGALLKGIAPSARLIRLRTVDGSDPAYLALIRQLPCLCCGLEPCGEAAHVLMSSAAHGKRSAKGKRPPDRWSTPLCGGCHRADPDALHRIGELPFWHRVGINPMYACERLYARRGDLVAMRAECFVIIAERMAH